MKLIKINQDHYELDGIKVTDRLSEIKELIGEVDVEKKAEEKYTKKDFASGEILIRKIAWINGYNQALEDNKDKKYTEDDIRKAFRLFFKNNMLEVDEIIQSLQPKTEWDVEIEMEDSFTKNDEVYVDENNVKGYYYTHSKKPKLDAKGLILKLKSE